MQREKKLVKNTIVLTFGTVLSKIATLLTLPICVKWLTKTEYGTYDLIITIVATILPIITFQIQSSAFRFLISDKKINNQKSILTNCYVFVIITTVMLGLFVLPFLSSYSFTIKFLIFIYVLFDILLQLTRQVCRGFLQNRKYVISGIIETFFKLILIIVFVVFLKFGLIGMFISLIISLFFAILYLFFKLKLYKLFNLKLMNKDILKMLLAYSIPLIPNSISVQIISTSDRLIITSVLGIEVNAVYAAANKIPSIYHMMYSTFNLAWQESASSHYKDKDINNYYTTIFNTLYRFLFTGLLILIAITPWLVSVLLIDSYSSALYQMPILYLALFLSSFSSFYGGIYIALKETKKVGKSSILAAVINVIINLLFIRHIGLYAASLSTLVAFLIVALYRAIDLKKWIKIDYDLKMIVISLLCFPIIIALCYINNIYLNILNVIISIILFLVFNKDTLQILLKKVKNIFHKNYKKRI